MTFKCGLQILAELVSNWRLHQANMKGCEEQAFSRGHWLWKDITVLETEACSKATPEMQTSAQGQKVYCPISR